MKTVSCFLLVALSFVGFSCGEKIAIDRSSRIDTDIDSFSLMLKTYREMNGRLPTTEEGLKALAARPANAGPAWRQLVPKIPNDSWGRPYQYIASPTLPNGYEIWSLGKDPQSASDDIHPMTRPSKQL